MSPITLWPLVAILLFLGIELATRAAISRRLWSELMRALTRLDLAAIALVRRAYPPRFVILGACQKRGLCCTQIVGNPPAIVKRTPWLLQLFAAYHRVFHHFRVVARGPAEELIFSCGHLKSDGRCGIYRFRPFLCRNYPLLPWFEPPKILPGCGFRIAPRVVARMQPHPSLPIVNAQVVVHHPSPPRGPSGAPEETPEHFHLCDAADTNALAFEANDETSTR